MNYTGGYVEDLGGVGEGNWYKYNCVSLNTYAKSFKNKGNLV